jgi:hypothetical protein
MKSILLSLTIATVLSIGITAPIFAQNTEENKNYILVFGHRNIGNLDNSTNYVTSVVGSNLTTLKDEFLEEISLEPSQQLQEQIEKIVNDGVSGAQCDTTLTTQQGATLGVNCTSFGNNVIWYLYQQEN